MIIYRLSIDYLQFTIRSSIDYLQYYIMSDTDKITAEIKTKVKDPKRVEAGKKLAALSKAAREKKKAMALEQPPASSWNYSLIGVVGIAIAMASLVIAYKGYNRKNAEPEQKFVQQPVPTVSNLESL